MVAETQKNLEKVFEKQRKFCKVNEIVEKYKYQKQNLIAILQEVQGEYRYLPEEIMTYIATIMSISPASVYGVATFYSQFSLDPKGKYEVKVCDGTACHVRGSMPVYKAIKEKLKLKDGKFTTEDLQFSVETVRCLGACALAPVVVINNKVYSKVTPEAVKIILDKLLERSGEGDKAND
ncbi:MAG TPA: NAD(P)H-dependent oxidoreductase subunit E [Candidatus Gastranaerophilales bacterium]|nr:NAD(P)H-dependent oxidoreductase subunit E [Candidatus Gastranaerophilales bacterium]